MGISPFLVKKVKGNDKNNLYSYNFLFLLQQEYLLVYIHRNPPLLIDKNI